MNEFELQQLRRNPAWTRLLEAYGDRLAKSTSKTERPQGLPRITELADTTAEELAAMHGKLIAYGFLDVELCGKDHGLTYELTPLSRQVLQGDRPGFRILAEEPAEAA